MRLKSKPTWKPWGPGGPGGPAEPLIPTGPTFACIVWNASGGYPLLTGPLSWPPWTWANCW